MYCVDGLVCGTVSFNLRESLLEQYDNDPKVGDMLISYPSPLFVACLGSDLSECPDLEGMVMKTL